VAAVERPFEPGDYDVVVVGSGPGGLQTSYCLRALGVRHALLSRDDCPGGMFRQFPIFQRLITWTKPDAPVERTSREYEWYDHNSLLADEPELKALVPGFMDRAFDLPARAEMEAGIAAFARQAALDVRYECEWESTRIEDDGRLVLATSDGEYRARAIVFALGVTDPWKADVPGLEHAAHYVDTRDPARYEDRDVFVVGKRNSGFEVAQGILPWARSITLGSPRPVQTEALALSALRTRYLHPYDEYARGGPGTYVIDVTIERIERSERFRVFTRGTTWDGQLEFDVDDVIAATGFRTPVLDLPDLGLVTVADGRIPALTPFWESVSLPGAYFAGNASQGARGLGKRGAGASSSAVNGFRYNARVLAQHLAEKLNGHEPSRTPVGDVVSFLLRELSVAPELLVQKGYLCRVVSSADDGYVDDGVQPVAHFLDAPGPDAFGATVEVDEDGTILPTLYVRSSGEIREHQLAPHPLHDYEGEAYRNQLAGIVS